MTPTHNAAGETTTTDPFYGGLAETDEVGDLTAAANPMREFVVYITKNPHAKESDWCRHSVREYTRDEAVAKALEICRFATGPAVGGERIHVEIFVRTGTYLNVRTGTYLKFEHRLVPV